MNNTYINNSIFKNFELYFPTDAENVVECHINGTCLTAILNNNSKIIYDDFTNTCRRLPSDPNNMTEKQIMDEFRYRLRYIMNNKGINVTDLSERTGIPQPMISNYLMGHNKPSIVKVDMIARALECSVDDLRYLE